MMTFLLARGKIDQNRINDQTAHPLSRINGQTNRLLYRTHIHHLAGLDAA